MLGIMRAMHLLTASLLGLGQSISSFGVTLALILTFLVCIGGLATALIVYAVGQVIGERQQNIARRRDFDAAHQR